MSTNYTAVCNICGPLKKEDHKNWLIPSYVIKDQKQFDHVKSFHMTRIKKPLPHNVCIKCVSTLEIGLIQNTIVEDLPLLVSIEFVSEIANKYYRKVLRAQVYDNKDTLLETINNEFLAR